MEDHLRRELMLSPPQHWAEIMRRTAVVRDYIAAGDNSTATAERVAASLGLRPRMFYNLVRIFRQRQEGAQVLASSQGRHEHLEPAVAEAIEDAIRELGPGAIEAQVRDRSAEICRSRGLSPPSRNAVWTRFGRPGHDLELGARLGVSANAVIDCCPLALDVVRDGRPSPACLLTLVDMATGIMPGRALIAGSPTRNQVVNVLNRWKRVGRMDVISTGGIPAQALDSLDALLDAEVAVTPVRALRAGAAARVVFGLRIGRVPLAPRRKNAGGPDVPPPLPFDDVQEVIHALVDERNADLRAA